MEADQIGLTAVIAALAGAVPIVGKWLLELVKTRGQQRLESAKLTQESDLKADELALSAYRTMFDHQLQRMDRMEAKLETVVEAEADCRVQMAAVRAEADAAKAEADRSFQLVRGLTHRVNDIQQQIVLTDAVRKIESGVPLSELVQQPDKPLDGQVDGPK